MHSSSGGVVLKETFIFFFIPLILSADFIFVGTHPPYLISLQLKFIQGSSKGSNDVAEPCAQSGLFSVTWSEISVIDTLSYPAFKTIQDKRDL